MATSAEAYASLSIKFARLREALGIPAWFTMPESKEDIIVEIMKMMNGDSDAAGPFGDGTFLMRARDAFQLQRFVFIKHPDITTEFEMVDKGVFKLARQAPQPQWPEIPSIQEIKLTEGKNEQMEAMASAIAGGPIPEGSGITRTVYDNSVMERALPLRSEPDEEEKLREILEGESGKGHWTNRDDYVECPRCEHKLKAPWHNKGCVIGLALGIIKE